MPKPNSFILWVPSPDILRTAEGIVEVIPNRLYKAFIESFAPLIGLKEHYVLAEIGERKVQIEENYTTGRYAYVPASQKHSRYRRGLLITEYINPHCVAKERSRAGRITGYQVYSYGNRDAKSRRASSPRRNCPSSLASVR